MNNFTNQTNIIDVGEVIKSLDTSVVILAIGAILILFALHLFDIFTIFSARIFTYIIVCAIASYILCSIYGIFYYAPLSAYNIPPGYALIVVIGLFGVGWIYINVSSKDMNSKFYVRPKKTAANRTKTYLPRTIFS